MTVVCSGNIILLGLPFETLRIFTSMKIFSYTLTSVLLCVFLICSLFGCGRKTDPIAPESNAPQVVSELTLQGKNEGVELSWKSPSRNLRGKKLYDLNRFEVRARVAKSNDSFKTLGRVVLNSKERAIFEKGQSVVERFGFLHSSIKPGEKYEYVVVPINDYGSDGAFSEIYRVDFNGVNSVVELVELEKERELEIEREKERELEKERQIEQGFESQLPRDNF